MTTATHVRVWSAICILMTLAAASRADDAWVTYAGGKGPGEGKHVVLISGDEEYRSEEGLPQLGKILSQRHGFRCSVLFAIDLQDGTINPNQKDNIPGLAALDTADLCVMLLRFRDLPDEQMKHVADYVESGRPIVALRTSTHAFDIKPNRQYERFGWKSKTWEGGFGRQVLGETWISHHGAHAKQSCRGLLVPAMREHPILRGLNDGDIWCPSDVYGVRLPLPEGCQPLVLGQVLTGMNSSDPPLEGPKNDPMMPVAWIKTFTGSAGKPARVFTTTMGAANDLASAGLRRLVVNACYWGVGLEDRIRPDASVEIVGEYNPSNFKFNGYVKGVKPSTHRLP